MTIYQTFLLGLLIFGATGFVKATRICYLEIIDPVFDEKERWITICCWGIALIWLTALFCFLTIFI